MAANSFRPSWAAGPAVSVLPAALLFLAACGGGAGESTTTSGPALTIPPGSVIADSQTDDGERYRVLLEGEAADNPRRLFAGEDAPRIPNGAIRPGDGGVNLGHEWHVTDVEFADMTMEVCDSTVSYVDDLG